MYWLLIAMIVLHRSMTRDHGYTWQVRPYTCDTLVRVLLVERLVVLPKKLEGLLEPPSSGEASADSGPAGSGLNSCTGRPRSVMCGLRGSGGAGGSIITWTSVLIRK